MQQRGCSRLIAILFSLILTGCSASTAFLPYPAKIAPLQQQLSQAAPPEDLAKILKRERRSHDQILYNMEHGRVAQLFGKIEMSRSDFAAAIAGLRSNDERALISASQIGANLASFALNDKSLPYSGEGYERVLLHHYQGLNYLLQGDLNGAGVELRWANLEQQEALNRHEKELDKAEQAGRAERIDSPAENSEFQRRYAQLDELAGRVKNSFQNAYSFYLSGLVYELQGEANDAYIDYKRALELYPENSYLQQDVLRLARQLRMDDDLAELAKRFPALYNLRSEAAAGGEGELLLLYEDGFVPPREEIKIAFFLPPGVAVSLAFPSYRGGWRQEEPLEVRNGGEVLGRTELLCDVRGLAVKSLQERMPIILTRQLVRLTGKILAQHAAKEKFGPLGELGMMAYTIMSENADLRSWLTLPENVQMLRLRLPAGRRQLHLQPTVDWGGTDLDLEVKAGGMTIVQVVRNGAEFHTAVVSFAK